MRRITLGITTAAVAAAALLAAGARLSASQPVRKAVVSPSAAAGHSALVFPGAGGRLVYKPWNPKGDTVLDFSNCGYGGGGVALPEVPVKATLAPVPGEADDTGRSRESRQAVS